MLKPKLEVKETGAFPAYLDPIFLTDFASNAVNLSGPQLNLELHHIAFFLLPRDFECFD